MKEKKKKKPPFLKKREKKKKKKKSGGGEKGRFRASCEHSFFFPPRSSKIQEHGNLTHGHLRLYFGALVPVSSAVPYIISLDSTRKNQAQLIVI